MMQLNTVIHYHTPVLPTAAIERLFSIIMSYIKTRGRIKLFNTVINYSIKLHYNNQYQYKNTKEFQYSIPILN